VNLKRLKIRFEFTKKYVISLKKLFKFNKFKLFKKKTIKFALSRKVFSKVRHRKKLKKLIKNLKF
jgi:hypothetical protein